MTQPTSSFTCDACGRSYAWKPELAGRRITCKCGEMFFAPDEAPASAVVDPTLMEVAEREGQGTGRRRRRRGGNFFKALFEVFFGGSGRS
jgi:hypothetical protein